MDATGICNRLFFSNNWGWCEFNVDLQGRCFFGVSNIIIPDDVLKILDIKKNQIYKDHSASYHRNWTYLSNGFAVKFFLQGFDQCISTGYVTFYFRNYFLNYYNHLSLYQIIISNSFLSLKPNHYNSQSVRLLQSYYGCWRFPFQLWSFPHHSVWMIQWPQIHL